MRWIFIFAMLFLSACHNTQKKNTVPLPETISADSKSSVDKAQLYITADSIVIAENEFDTITYSKKEFNEIIDYFPTLNESVPVHPDISYAQSGYFRDIKDSDGVKKHISFGSEVGQDRYYILYAYFLKQRNQGVLLDQRRKNLTTIYQAVNDIFALLNYGGTFFGHQQRRICGYVQFGVYQYKTGKDFFTVDYDIAEQKNLYLKALRQVISDKIKTDNEIPYKNSKDVKQKELYTYVTKLDSLITDNFYLKKAQEFQYSNY